MWQNRIVKRFAWLFLFLLLIGGGFWIFLNKGPGKIEIVYETKDMVQKRKDAKMAKTLEEFTKNQTGQYAIKVVRLMTGENYGFDENATMAARSVIKVPIILTAIRLGYEEKYNDLLLRMGVNSDNNAQVKIEKVVGKEEIKKTLMQLDMKDTDFDQNITTAEDLAKLWKYVYENKDSVEKYFVDSIYEDRISKGIPEGVKLIHKVGTDVNIWNDSGIVVDTKTFILVILNQGVKREEAEKAVPEITKMVWDYEMSL